MHSEYPVQIDPKKYDHLFLILDLFQYISLLITHFLNKNTSINLQY